MSARNWTLGLAIGAVLTAGAPAALAAGSGGEQPVRALRAPLPGGLGPCVPGTCPNPFPQIGTGTRPVGTDNAVNIFVGGDFLVRERAAEAEGRVVVLGTFDQDKVAGASSAYNIGIVGAGSLVQPPLGSDFLTTGRNVNIAAGERLISDGGVVRHAGTAPGAGTVTGTLRADPNAVAPYAGLRDDLTAAGKCYARIGAAPRPATGTVVNQDGTFVFTGDDSSPLQVFTLDTDLVGRNGGAVGIRFARIPAKATVLVNVLGTTRTINTYSGTIVDGADTFNALRTRLLWNFPDATTVNLNGSGQFQGSVLIGEQRSRATVTLPGMNGRFFTTGNLTHTGIQGGGGGQEFHAYPFDGDLPDCAPPVTTGAVSVLKRDETGRPLAGARFELWRETNDTPGLQTTGAEADTRVTECTTPENGICSHTTDLGRYYWRETVAPAGHRPAPNPVFPLELTADNANAGARVTVDNERLPVPTAKVVLWKSDLATGAALPGGRFDLWRESNGRTGLQTGGTDPDTRLPGECVTDADGSCTVYLPVGPTYYWREIAAPDGYNPPEDPVVAFTPDEGDVTEGIVVNVPNTREPEEDPGTLRVVKKDAKTGRPLRGAVFEVWKETNNTAGLQTRGINADRRVKPGCATDRVGICDFDRLSEGSYYLVETDVPEGYVLPGNRVTGPLRLDGTTPNHRLVVTLHNKRDDHGKDPKGPRA
ncbi:choice-of-anchor A family protein [Streptomyces sp. NBC_00513]|uniref:choice-of-anchor A family protein n=1 Tax=unclassified Streptomyces TaxID=2593676 RepID=UPI000B324406|nr:MULTISPECIES: choice-of-anchor A family protein [unclassified Streptomyces]MCX5073271.1 choice-of-anchor A family protein [Streptomyces sp. NBC_00424]MCX5155202.1 choice-of-anchor A family protein [Streptomyces sp. NBC_00291]WUD43459.1 choice-of-anchor A family protein [Streptomyces sp. NBC_00513]